MPTAPRLKRVLALLICSASAVAAPAATTPRLWNHLEPGPYGVGFLVLHRSDDSRNWKPKRTFRGEVELGERGRPIRISVWYPAEKDSGRGMTFGDYVRASQAAPRFRSVEEQLSIRFLRSLRGVIKGEEVLQHLLHAEVAGRWGAKAAKGRFPVVLYASGLNETWQQANFVLGEYLASHGYVVAAVGQLGSSPVRTNFGINAVDFETLLRDLEYTWAIVQRLSFADRNRLAVMGHSVGGALGLALTMRGGEADAVIGLDAAYTNKRVAEVMKSAPYYSAGAVRVPLLDLRRANNKEDLTILDALRHSDRYLVEIPGVQHADFTSFPFIARLYPAKIEARTPELGAQGYGRVCRSVLGFLKAQLQNEPDALKVITTPSATEEVAVHVEVRKGLSPTPTVEELVAVLQREGLESALELLQRTKLREPDQNAANTRVLTSIGYGFIAEGKPELAVGVFRLLTEAQPTSADAYDSLADAYTAQGDAAKMLEAYRRVLDLLPDDSSLDAPAKKDLEERARGKLNEKAK